MVTGKYDFWSNGILWEHQHLSFQLVEFSLFGVLVRKGEASETQMEGDLQYYRRKCDHSRQIFQELPQSAHLGPGTNALPLDVC